MSSPQPCGEDTRVPSLCSRGPDGDSCCKLPYFMGQSMCFRCEDTTSPRQHQSVRTQCSTPSRELRPDPQGTRPTGALAKETLQFRGQAPRPRPEPPEVSDYPSGLESSQEKTRMSAVSTAKFRRQRPRAGTEPPSP